MILYGGPFSDPRIKMGQRSTSVGVMGYEECCRREVEARILVEVDTHALCGNTVTSSGVVSR